MLHQYVPRTRVADPARHFAKHFLQLLSMTGRRAIVGNGINRASRLGRRVFINAHSPSEFLPRWTVHKRIGVPGAQVAFVRRHSRACSFHSRFRTKMGDDDVIPRVAVLMAKDNKMIGHWITLIRRLQPIAQLNGLTKSGLGEVDMVNVRSFAGSRGCRTLFTGSGLWRSLAVNERNRQQAK